MVPFMILFYFSHALWVPEIFEKNSVQTLTVCLSGESIITGNPILEVKYDPAETRARELCSIHVQTFMGVVARISVCRSKQENAYVILQVSYFSFPVIVYMQQFTNY